MNISFSYKMWMWPNVLALIYVIPVLINFIELQEWCICDNHLTSFTTPKAFSFLACKLSESFLKRVFTTETFLLWEIYKAIMQKYQRDCTFKTRPERHRSSDMKGHLIAAYSFLTRWGSIWSKDTTMSSVSLRWSPNWCEWDFCHCFDGGCHYPPVTPSQEVIFQFIGVFATCRKHPSRAEHFLNLAHQLELLSSDLETLSFVIEHFYVSS